MNNVLFIILLITLCVTLLLRIVSYVQDVFAKISFKATERVFGKIRDTTSTTELNIVKNKDNGEVFSITHNLVLTTLILSILPIIILLVLYLLPKYKNSLKVIFIVLILLTLVISIGAYSYLIDAIEKSKKKISAKKNRNLSLNVDYKLDVSSILLIVSSVIEIAVLLFLLLSFKKI